MADEFFTAVKDMRLMQRAYFKERTQTNLQIAKASEARVDRLIAARDMEQLGLFPDETSEVDQTAGQGEAQVADGWSRRREKASTRTTGKSAATAGAA